ncbi:hypothetical protein D3C75_667560 [compost metagenome]
MSLYHLGLYVKADHRIIHHNLHLFITGQISWKPVIFKLADFIVITVRYEQASAW